MNEQNHKKDNSFDKINPRANKSFPTFKKIKTNKTKKRTANVSKDNPFSQKLDNTFTIASKENYCNLRSQNQNSNLKTIQFNNININNYYNTANTSRSNNSKISYIKYIRSYNNSSNIPIHYPNSNKILFSPKKYENNNQLSNTANTERYMTEEDKKLLEIMKIQQQNFSRPSFSNKLMNKSKTIIKQNTKEKSNINSSNPEDLERYERKTFNAKQKINIMMDEDFSLNNNKNKSNKNNEEITGRKTYTKTDDYENVSNKYQNKKNNLAKDYVNEYDNINNNNQKRINSNSNNIRYHSISIKNPNMEKIYTKNNIKNTNLDRFTKNYLFFNSPPRKENNAESSPNYQFFGKNKTFELGNKSLNETQNQNIKSLPKNCNNEEYINKTVIIQSSNINVNNRGNHSLFESKNFKHGPNSKKLINKYVEEKNNIVNKTIDYNTNINLDEESAYNNIQQNNVRIKTDNLTTNNTEKNIFIKNQDKKIKNCINNSLRYNKEKNKEKENNSTTNNVKSIISNSSNNILNNKNNTMNILDKNIKATKTNVIIRKNKTEKKIKREKLNKTNLPTNNTKIYINHEIHITINKLTKDNNNTNSNNEKNIKNNNNNDNNSTTNENINNDKNINKNATFSNIINTNSNANINKNTNLSNSKNSKTSKSNNKEGVNVKIKNNKVANLNLNNIETTKNIKTITNTPKNVIQDTPENQNSNEKSPKNLDSPNNSCNHNPLNDSNDSNSSQDDKKPDYNNDDLSNLEEMPKVLKPVIQHSIQRKRPVYTLPPSRKRALSQGKSLNIIHKYYDENFILEDDEEEEVYYKKNKDEEIENEKSYNKTDDKENENNN